MIILRASAWQIPFATLEVGDIEPSDTTIVGKLGAAVDSIATRYANDSMPGSTPKESYSSGPLTLKTGTVPFFPELSIGTVRASSLFDVPLVVRKGKKRFDLSVPASNNATILRTNLCQFLSARIQAKHVLAKAAAQGVGLSTKERFQLNRAESEATRLGNTNLAFHGACDSPIVMSPQGLYVRAGAAYSPFTSVCSLVEGSATPLGPKISAHKSEVVSFYKRMYPDAPDGTVEDALADAGIDDFYSTTFKAYFVSATASRMMLKSPLTRQMEKFPITEAMSLANDYLATMIRTKVDASGIPPLVDEYIASLKRRGFTTQKSDFVKSESLLASAIKELSGYESDINMSSVVSAHYSWASFSRGVNEAGTQYHPMLWSNLSIAGYDVTGDLPNGESGSFTADDSVIAMISLISDRRDVCEFLLGGWEDHVAATYSASFEEFTQNESSYLVKTFAPVLRSIGVLGGMMPNDIIGIVYE